MAQSAQVKGVNPWHEKLAAWMLVHANSPGWNKRASEEFGVSAAWISTVVHSDAFQDYYQRLRGETVVPAVFSARERMLGTLDHAITLVQEKLEKEGELLPMSGLLNTVDILAKRTGHGESTRDSNPTLVQNNIQVVTQSDLQESRARMRGGKYLPDRSPLPLALDAGNVPDTSQTEGTS